MEKPAIKPSVTPQLQLTTSSRRPWIELVLTAGLLTACPNENASSTDTASVTDVDTSGTTNHAPTTSVGTATTGEMSGTSEGELTSGTDNASSISSSSETTNQTATTGSLPPVCGNGMIEEGEACDDEDQVDYNACSNDCQENPCVHGIKIISSDAGDPENDIGDWQGASVRMIGDKLLVSAPEKKGTGLYNGAVYVYEWKKGQVIEIQKIVADDEVYGEGFGTKIDATSDFLAVTSPFHLNINSRGSVYVYKIENGEYVLQQKLQASDGQKYDSYGNYIAMTTNLMAVSGGHEVNGKTSGLIYVYEQKAGVWQETGILKIGDGFGTNRLSAVEVNVDTIFASAVNDGENGVDSGAVLVFKKINNEWSNTSKIVLPDAQTKDFFGTSIKVNGGQIAITSANELKNGGIGSVEIFDITGYAWNQRISPQNVNQKDNFGGGNEIDFNGNLMVVGNPWNDDNGEDAGAAYVYQREGEVWLNEQKIKLSGDLTHNYFGMSVSLDGEFFLVGAPNDIENGDSTDDEGAAYLYCLGQTKPQ